MTRKCYKLMLSTLMLMLLFCLAQPLAAHPSFNIRRGLSALQQGDLEQAETELQRARFAEPDNPIVSYNLGVVSYRRRDYQKAAGFFTQAAAAAGRDDKIRFDSLYNLGNAAFKAGDYAAAVSAYGGSIEVKADQKAEYNLEVARKKLQEQQEQQQDQQDQQQNQQEKDKSQQQQKKDQQKQDQKGQQDKGDQSDSPENQQNEDQKNSDSKSDNEKQQQDQQSDQQNDQQNEQNDGQNQEGSEEQKNGEESESEQQQADKPSSGEEEQNASQTQELKEQAAADPSENRQDVDMGTDETQSQQPQKPDASQRARALKNVKLNPYQVERLLQQMQERERQAQLHYRNEPQRMDEADPFEMDAQQLQEWFANRGRRQPRQQTDEPDW